MMTQKILYCLVKNMKTFTFSFLSVKCNTLFKSLIDSGLKEVYLHDNPWKCDCSINSLVHYVAQTRANHLPLQRLRCISPEEFRDRPIHQLKAEELPCRA